MEAADKHSDGDATQGDAMTAGATDTCHDQEPFSFMKLPPELRLMVYHFALHDITDPIMFPPSGEAQKPHPCRGALALLDTSKGMREESYYAMKHTVHAYHDTLSKARMAIASRNVRLVKSVGFEFSAYTQLSDDFERASCHIDCMRVVTGSIHKAIHKVAMASEAESKAQDENRLAALLLAAA